MDKNNEKNNDINLDDLYELDESVSETEKLYEQIDDGVQLDIYITDEEALNLTEEECMIIATKIEIELDAFEEILLHGQNRGLNEEAIIELGFDPDEYQRLRSLEKAIYAQIKRIRKSQKSKGFFAALPGWTFILGLICIIFNIPPINPYLPVLIYQGMYASFESTFMKETSGMILIYVLYLVLFYLTELIVLGILFFLGRKDHEKRKSAYAFLVVLIITVLSLIPAIVLFIKAISDFL